MKNVWKHETSRKPYDASREKGFWGANPTPSLGSHVQKNLRDVTILVVIVVSVSGNTWLFYFEMFFSWGAAGVFVELSDLSLYCGTLRAIMAFRCWHQILIHYPWNWRGTCGNVTYICAQGDGNVWKCKSLLFVTWREEMWVTIPEACIQFSHPRLQCAGFHGKATVVVPHQISFRPWQE